MKRYSANTNLIPDPTCPGRYELWVSLSEWDGNRCVRSIPVFNKTIENFVECGESLHASFAFLMESSDMIYQEITTRYAEVCRAMDETNARPSSASTN